MFVLALSSFIFTTQAELADLQQSRFTLIDGKPAVNGLQDSKVVGTVVKNAKDPSGKYILYGFTDLNKFHQYLANHHSATAKNPQISSFYEHIDMKGARLDVRLGTQIRYVGDRWNDKISSVHPACNGSWTILYQHADFRGDALAIENSNNLCRYYFNLTQFKLSNGQSWNDQASSIRVY